MNFAIDAMPPLDWDAVRAIYLEGIATRNATFETAAPDWERWDAAHLPFARLVTREAGEVLGWAALSPVSSRTCYAGVAEASIYVAEKHWRHGVGSALLAALIEAAEKNGVWTLQASIFPENASSLALVTRFGFREVGRRERIAQLNGVWRDTLILERRSRVAGA
jgi:L-amino acid N-acyltransferase YncA